MIENFRHWYRKDVAERSEFSEAIRALDRIHLTNGKASHLPEGTDEELALQGFEVGSYEGEPYLIARWGRPGVEAPPWVSEGE